MYMVVYNDIRLVQKSATQVELKTLKWYLCMSVRSLSAGMKGYTELINGRAAMVGIVAALGAEFTGHTVASQVFSPAGFLSLLLISKAPRDNIPKSPPVYLSHMWRVICFEILIEWYFMTTLGGITV